MYYFINIIKTVYTFFTLKLLIFFNYFYAVPVLEMKI